MLSEDIEPIYRLLVLPYGIEHEASAPRNTTARTKIELYSQKKFKYPRTQISSDLLNFHDLPHVEAKN